MRARVNKFILQPQCLKIEPLVPAQLLTSPNRGTKQITQIYANAFKTRSCREQRKFYSVRPPIYIKIKVVLTHFPGRSPQISWGVLLCLREKRRAVTPDETHADFMGALNHDRTK